METLENAEVGQKIRWKTAEECPNNNDFITTMARKYPGELQIAGLEKAPHGSSYKEYFKVTCNGCLITPDLDSWSSCAISPFWFMPCD